MVAIRYVDNVDTYKYRFLFKRTLDIKRLNFHIPMFPYILCIKQFQLDIVMKKLKGNREIRMFQTFGKFDEIIKLVPSTIEFLFHFPQELNQWVVSFAASPYAVARERYRLPSLEFVGVAMPLAACKFSINKNSKYILVKHTHAFW